MVMVAMPAVGVPMPADAVVVVVVMGMLMLVEMVRHSAAPAVVDRAT